uniref:Protein PHYTOCHROME KINASE SUBSTRATE 4 n=1 Tax=Glycine max TaxID=3847 RepID=A0A368UGF1_SOYBN
MERAIPTNLNPKSSPTFKDRSVSFSSPHHLTPDQPNKSEPPHAMMMRPNDGLRTLDPDPITSELSTFGAHRYFNQGTNNNNDNTIQKATINSNSRVSPLLNMDTEHKHNNQVQEQGDITKSTRSKISVKPPQTSSNLTEKLKTSLSKPIWLLRRKCPCNDKKSVQVKGNTNTNTNKNKTKNSPKAKTPPPQPKTLSHNQIHKDSLNYKAPPPPSSSSNKEVKAQRLFQFQPSMNQLRKPSREGFNFPLFLATNNSTNPTKSHHHHHHQVLLNVVNEEDTIPRESLHVFQPPSPPKSRAMDDDAASDASSDLFEIESFSTQTTTTLPYPIITPSITQCHESTDHEFFFATDAGGSLWRRRLRDTEVLPPL